MNYGGGTIGRADIYGTPTTAGGVMAPLSIQNQNGDSVAPMTQTASGGATSGGNGPAISVVGLILALVLLRLALHAAARA